MELNFKHQNIYSSRIHYEIAFKHFERRSCKYHTLTSYYFLRLYSHSCHYLVFIFPLPWIRVLFLGPSSLSCILWTANLKLES